MDTIDSLKRESLKATSDSTLSKIYADIAYEYLLKSSDSALAYSFRSLKAARQSGNDKIRINSYGTIALAYQRHSEYDSSLVWFEKALDIAEAIDDKRYQSVLHNNMGITLKYMGRYETAIEHYLKGIDIDQQNDYRFGVAAKQANIARIYDLTGNLQKSLEHEQISLNINLDLSKEEGYSDAAVAIAYNNLASSYLGLKNYDSAMVNLEKALQINRRLGNNLEVGRNLHNMAMLNHEFGNYNKALSLDNQALQYRLKAGDPYSIAESYINLGKDYGFLKNLKQAEQYFQSGLKQSEALEAPELFTELYHARSEVYRENKNYEKAFEDFEKYLAIKDSLSDAQLRARIEELQIKFETEKKDRKLIQQKLAITEREERIHYKSMMNKIYLLIIILFSILIIAGTLFFLQRRRRIKLEISQLKQQKKLENLSFLMAGEEKERARLAQELHDGINGSLAAIRLLTTAEKSTSEEQLKRIGTLLDEVSDEVREISHNLLPGSLERLGLIEAVEEYISKINQGGNLQIVFDHFGNPDKLTESEKLTAYRLVQELLKNVLHHAHARECHVQLLTRDNSLFITIEDDGKGFKPGAETSGKGIGLKNIASRIELAEGKLDIISEENSGTSITIELPLFATAI